MKIQYLVDKFKDFQGIERTFTLAAVPTDCYNYSMSPKELLDFKFYDNCCCNDTAEYVSNSMLMRKKIMFGVAICHPNDVKTVNEDLGKKIAEGKAISKRSRIAEIQMTSGMFMTYDYIEMCLKRLAELIKKNPENYSIAYKEAKERFKKKARHSCPVVEN